MHDIHGYSTHADRPCTKLLLCVLTATAWMALKSRFRLSRRALRQGGEPMLSASSVSSRTFLRRVVTLFTVLISLSITLRASNVVRLA